MALGPKTDNSIEGGDGNAQVGQNSGTVIVGISFEQHQAALEKALADKTADLERAHGAERELLQRQIDDLQRKLADPQTSLLEAQKRIKDLETLLDREGDDIGAERIEAAKAALEQGDYSLADDLFTEIEAHTESDLKNTAHAAFGRGEIANAELRWNDALEHFLRAEQLNPTTEYVLQVTEAFSNLGFFDRALNLLDQHLVGERISETNLELYNAKMTVLAFARQTEKASEIAKEIDGFLKRTKKPDAGLVLNVKICLLRALVITDERAQIQAILKDTRKPLKSLEKEDPVKFARFVGNIASLLADTGYLTRAISLTRSALKILRAEKGNKHPLYAIRLNNLGDFLTRGGDYEEAIEHLHEAITLGSEYLPKGHHSLLVRRSNLALAIEEKGDVLKAIKARQQVLEESFLQVHLNYDLICGNLSVLVGLRLDVKDTSGAVKAIDWFQNQTDIIPLSVKARQPLVDATQECRGAVFDHAMRP